jgi:hypothetical protein
VKKNKRAEEFIRAGRLILKARALQQRAGALEDEAKRILKTSGFLCYGLYGESQKHIALEVPLQDYLAIFPDSKPRYVTWTTSKGEKWCKFTYPDRWLPDSKDGYYVAIGSGTESVVLAEEQTPAEVA